jgi:polyribonucleotide 5'-hydroxyl-kinase
MTVGHERLYADMKSDSRLSCSIVKLGKSGGVVNRTQAMRNALRNKSIREYFYGAKNELTPHSKTVQWRDVIIYRVGGGPQAPTSALPIGAVRLVESNAVVKVSVGMELLNSVMGVSWGLDGKSVGGRSVCGYVYVSGVDVAKKTVTLLTPAPGPLPSMCFITGTIKWFD